MAFRLRPLHEDTLQFAGLSNTQILILALEASQKLEWNIEELTLEGVRFDVPMSIKSHGEEITVSIQEGSDGEISVRSQSIAMQLVDYGKNRKNIQSLQKAMEEIKSTLSPEELEQKAKKLEDDFNRPLTEEEEAYLKEIEKKSSFISFFIPRKGFIATPILMDLNLLIFILMVAFGVGILEPSTLALLKWGADFGPLTLTGDWWRAITCNFIHIGAFHLLMNMYAFMYIGLWLEDLIGTRRMFISYNCLNSTYKTGLNSTCVKNILDHICCCCLAFCSCNSNCKKLFCRITKIVCRHNCKCKSCILCFDNCYI